jgi:hypothetical protein
MDVDPRDYIPDIDVMPDDVWAKVKRAIIASGENVRLETFISSEKLVRGHPDLLTLKDVAGACFNQKLHHLAMAEIFKWMLIAFCISAAVLVVLIVALGEWLGPMKSFFSAIAIAFISIVVIQKLHSEMKTEQHMSTKLETFDDFDGTDERILRVETIHQALTISDRLQALYYACFWRKVVGRYNDVIRQARGSVHSQTSVEDIDAILGLISLRALSYQARFKAISLLMGAIVATVMVAALSNMLKTHWVMIPVLVMISLCALSTGFASAKMWREFESFRANKGFPAAKSLTTDNFQDKTDRLALIYSVFRATNTLSWTQKAALACTLIGVSASLGAYGFTMCVTYSPTVGTASVLSLAAVAAAAGILGIALAFSAVG